MKTLALDLQKSEDARKLGIDGVYRAIDNMTEFMNELQARDSRTTTFITKLLHEAVHRFLDRQNMTMYSKNLATTIEIDHRQRETIFSLRF